MSDSTLHRTAFHPAHVAAEAKLVEFAGWDMPVQYPTGIVAEHLACRHTAGLFDVSHMGRFYIEGPGATAFLQRVLTNNCEALDEMMAQYTMIPNERGGALDDAYLYRITDSEYLLVVNASNREADLMHLRSQLHDGERVSLVDRTHESAMLSLQGPTSRAILESLIEDGTYLPEPARNYISDVRIAGIDVRIARTGYTGEPLCFELFVANDDALAFWDILVAAGAVPVGLGGRDTLRLEASLPLYGHELGVDPDGVEIPIFAVSLARFAVSFSPLKGDFIGRDALAAQHDAYQKFMTRDPGSREALPRVIQPIAIAGRGVARGGCKLFTPGGNHVGYVSSGTMVPRWGFEGRGLESHQTEEHKLRSICLGYINSDLYDGQELEVDIRNKRVPAVVVKYHMRSEAPPFARPIVYDFELEELPMPEPAKRAATLLRAAADNTNWRQNECINLIPSEMTPSALTRMLTIADPAGRYAEHKKSKAFYDADIFYYQGTEFIDGVERQLEDELRRYLGCTEVETRLISGQMANATVFSAMVDYLNRTDRKVEQRRMRMVMNNHIGKGGHLSSQPMGALRDFVMRDTRMERPAVVNFPVHAENQYKMDVEEAKKLIDENRPELIILGKSMVLHREPVAEIRQFLTDAGIDSVLMYDMAHVLGLVGPHFQNPFAEGADFVTGSTHKTFFGTQRGIVAGNYTDDEERWELWEALRRRAFPGATSNHHLGTMVGLLLATLEMNHFKDAYQPQVIANAKAFARALAAEGLDVAGDSEIDYTETHQVVVHVGYAHGPEVATRLEKSNLICNYQACPDEESFTAAGALRFGVSEMTRFGMVERDFETLAPMIADVVLRGKTVREDVSQFRKQFLEMKYCFTEDDFADEVQQLHRSLGI